MVLQTVPLDLAALTPDQQVTRLKERYLKSRHIAFSPDGECAFIGCESTDEVAVIDLRRQTVLDLIEAGAWTDGQ